MLTRLRLHKRNIPAELTWRATAGATAATAGAAAGMAWLMLGVDSSADRGATRRRVAGNLL